jgi:hypothetical protein
MMTFSASTSCWAVSSAVVFVISPSILLCDCAVGAMPPKRTFVMDRFMATHIMYERMEPETPISAPIVVSKELSNMKPSATRANPE